MADVGDVSLIFFQRVEKPGKTPIVVFTLEKGGIDDVVEQSAKGAEHPSSPSAKPPAAGGPTSSIPTGTCGAFISPTRFRGGERRSLQARIAQAGRNSSWPRTQVHGALVQQHTAVRRLVETTDRRPSLRQKDGNPAYGIDVRGPVVVVVVDMSLIAASRESNEPFARVGAARSRRTDSRKWRSASSNWPS